MKRVWNMIAAASLLVVGSVASADAALLSMSGYGDYVASETDSGTFTYPQSGSFTFDVSGYTDCCKAGNNGSAAFSGFPDLVNSTLAVSRTKLSNGVNIVQGYAYFDRLLVSLQLAVSDEVFNDILTTNKATLTPANSTERFGYIFLYGPNERYSFRNDNYSLTADFSAVPPGTVSPVPLPGAAPMLGAALLALGGIGFVRKGQRRAEA